MAHCLRRAFGDTPDLYLFHDLRLERDGDAAQVDHLLLHRFGLIIIESKSVTTEVEVNEHGEWCRNFHGQRRGMASPVEQARRQGEFLRAYLQEHREQLRGKYLLGLKQGGFRNMPVDLLVAISDEGIIRRAKRLDLPEVLKADQISVRILELLKEYRRVNSLFNLKSNEGGYEFRPEEMERISGFLLEHHRPLRRSEQPVQVPDPTPSATPVGGVSASATAPSLPEVPVAELAGKGSSHQCRNCQSGRLTVEWGRYNYYFKCADCQGNTPIREICAACGEKEKLRKSGPRFFAECGACSTSRLYYVNPL
jgi:hypothetical protein